MRTIVEIFRTPQVLMVWLILKIAIIISFLYPFLIVIVALFGYPWLTVTFALIGILLFFMVVADPLLIGAVALISGGRRLLTLIGLVLGFELLFALYLVIVPITSVVSLIPVFLLVILALIFLPSYDPYGMEKFVTSSRSVLTFLAIGITILFFLYAVIPSTLNAVGGAVSRWDGKTAGWLLDTTSVKQSPVVATVIYQNSVANIPTEPEKKDLISFPIHLTKGVRSEKIDLYNYNYRRMVDVIVTGRTLVKFQNGSTDTVDIGKSLSGKVERQAIFWMTALDGDVDATSIAWN
ncbi:MAG: hypothetical protein AAB377_01375 [Patescibacteria group bacterium]